MDAPEVDRRPRPSTDPVDRPVVAVEPPDPDGPALGEPLQIVADGHLARGDRPGHDRPVPGQGEGAVDRHPEQARVVAGRGPVAEPAELGSRSSSIPRPVVDRGPDDLGRLQERPGHQGPDVLLDQGEPARRRPGRTWSGRRRRRRGPRSRRISRCSRVCGITESSAATTSMARSRPEAPASMFRMNRSWPGTSTRARWRPSRSSAAKPRSIVIPRCFSAGSRSVSTPGQGPDQRGLAVVDVPGRPDHQVASPAWRAFRRPIG